MEELIDELMTIAIETFVGENKRTPTQEELISLRSQVSACFCQSKEAARAKLNIQIQLREQEISKNVIQQEQTEKVFDETRGFFTLKKDDVMILYDDVKHTMIFAGEKALSRLSSLGLSTTKSGAFEPGQYISIKKQLYDEFLSQGQ
jgi:hypothetical protein